MLLETTVRARVRLSDGSHRWHSLRNSGEWPRAGFDDPLPPAPTGRSPFPIASHVLPPPHVSEIRAYDLPDDVPGGAHRVVFDLDTIPEGSPCGGVLFDTITGQDGIVYAAGCQQTDVGTCAPQPFVCVFDTNTGAMRAPLMPMWASTIWPFRS